MAQTLYDKIKKATNNFEDRDGFRNKAVDDFIPDFQYTPVDLATSDIRPLVRAELREIREAARKLSSKAKAPAEKAHYADVEERARRILDGPLAEAGS